MTHHRKHSRSSAGAPAQSGVSDSRTRPWLRAGLFVAGAVLIAVTLGLAIERFGFAPRLLGSYVERRTAGLGDWIAAGGRAANRVLQALDRAATPPQPALPDWVGARVLPPARAARPVAPISAPEQLREALGAAQPGDEFVIGPGTYRFAGAALQTPRGGTEAAPIIVRAETFGTVTLEFDTASGLHVTAPFWLFENLIVRGVCANGTTCEHGFHVVGGAHHVVIRNNLMSDFNVLIKASGRDGLFPDLGRILDNTLVNGSPRRTTASVMAIELEAVRGWSIERNLIADVVKAEGDFTSYGASARGAGSGNRFLRNVVLCELRLRGTPGARVGLSFGGGGSSPERCRDGKCTAEHEDGLMAANLIASCSDEGIYIKRSPRSHLDHNTVLDTAGIYLRYPETSAIVTANVVDGPIRAREGARLRKENNADTALWALYLGWHPMRSLFVDTGSLDLRFRSPPARATAPQIRLDLCGAERPQRSTAGAFEDFAACLRAGHR